MSDGVMLSLFDRLIDDDPDAATEDRDDHASQRRVKQSLRRDLEGLLNAKRPHARWLARNGDLDTTVLGFGLPDLSTDDFGSPAVRERIRRMIVATIRTHEPRLTQIEVETDGGPTSAGIRFRISATMLVDRAEEAVVYDARLRPTDREFAVRLSR